MRKLTEKELEIQKDLTRKKIGEIDKTITFLEIKDAIKVCDIKATKLLEPSFFENENRLNYKKISLEEYKEICLDLEIWEMLEGEKFGYIVLLDDQEMFEIVDYPFQIFKHPTFLKQKAEDYYKRLRKISSDFFSFMYSKKKYEKMLKEAPELLDIYK